MKIFLSWSKRFLLQTEIQFAVDIVIVHKAEEHSVQSSDRSGPVSGHTAIACRTLPITNSILFWESCLSSLTTDGLPHIMREAAICNSVLNSHPQRERKMNCRSCLKAFPEPSAWATFGHWSHQENRINKMSLFTQLGPCFVLQCLQWSIHNKYLCNKYLKDNLVKA